MLAKRVQNVQASATLAISAKAKALKKEGHDVVGFGAGEPDFDTPEFIKQAAIEALNQGQTKYTPASGMPELKEAIREKFLRDNNIDYETSQITVNIGAKHSIFNIIQVICDIGDEVIIPAPYWVSYPEMVKLAGGKPVILQTSFENEFKIQPAELERIITNKTKALILNYPSNPTGTVYTEDELREIGEVVKKYKILVISDEIYEKLIYDDYKFVSFAALDEELKNLTVTVNGVSKAYSMTGWRIGYAAGPKEIIDAINRLQSHSTSNPVTFAQIGAIEALRGDQSVVSMMVSEFDKRRKRIYDLATSIPGVKAFMPKGAFYLFPDFSDVVKRLGYSSAFDFAIDLLEKAKVAVVPGEPFGAPGFIRLSYATSMQNIEKGLDRIKEFCG